MVVFLHIVAVLAIVILVACGVSYIKDYGAANILSLVGEGLPIIIVSIVIAFLIF